ATAAYQAGNGAFDFTRLPGLLGPLGRVPLFAALGPLDGVPGLDDPNEPWASGFAGSPAPFGSGPAAPGVAAVSSGGPSRAGHRYYSFDATQNGGRVRVIVLDNSKRPREASDPG